MTTPHKRHPWQRFALQGVNLAAILVGLKFGYAFGLEIGGMPLALFLAAMTALFATLVVDVLSSYLDRLASPEAGDRLEQSAPHR